MPSFIINGVWILFGLSLIVYMTALYNRAVSYKQSVESAKSSIGVELKKRADLIPEIINSVKGFVKHEKELMQKLTELRADTKGEFMKTFYAVAEEYPTLRSSEAFIQLQNTLENVEKNIAASRHIYNANVDYYNSLINSFPTLLFGFSEMKYLEFDTTQEEKIHVPQDFN